MTKLNGMDIGELREFRAAVEKDSAKADRTPVVVARWLGGSRSEVTSLADGATAFIGGDGELNSMRMLLGTLAACDVDLVVTRAALMGLELESLEVEATGHFNVQRYIGVDGSITPGYDRVSYTVRVVAKDATPEQLAELRRACEEASPVGGTLQRQVALSIDFQAG